MRAFLAFPLQSGIKEDLSICIEGLRSRFGEIKWVDSEKLHITIFFFGEITREQAEEIKSICLDKAKYQSTIAAEYKGIDYFPRKGSPRVVISPLTRGVEACRSFYQSLAPSLSKVADFDTKQYIPHITLGRVKKGLRISRDLGDSFAMELCNSFPIDRAVLYESVLQPEGPVYNELASFAFTGSV